MSYDGGQSEGSYDQNGNFCVPTKPKESVLQILSDTLGGTPNASADGPSSVAFVPLKDDYTAIQVSDDGPSASKNNSDPNFSPGDKLCIDSAQPVKASNYPTKPKIKDCHLTTVVGSARRCLKQLAAVKQGLASLVTSDDHHKVQDSSIERPNYELIALLGEYTMYLTRQVFIPAHRLYTTALGLHMSEDLIRNPKDPALLNFRQGPVIRPDWNSIIHTQMKLRTCVDSATELYHRFGRESVAQEKLQQIMVTLMHAFQDLYATALGSNDIFKVLLHIEDYGEQILQDYLLSLKSSERSDLLVQVQTLRRSFDDIVIMVEQLSWTAYAVYRLATEKSLNPTPEVSNSTIPLPPRSRSRLDVNGNVERSHRRKESNDSEVKSKSDSSYLDSLKNPTEHRRRSSSRSASRNSRNPTNESDSDEKIQSGHRSKSSESSRHRQSRIPTPTSSPPARSRKSSHTSLPDEGKSSYSSQLPKKGHRSEGRKDDHSSNARPKSRGSRSSVSSRESTGSIRDSSRSSRRDSGAENNNNKTEKKPDSSRRSHRK